MMTQRVLLVEDEQHIQEAIRMNLELEGYEVVTASDGPDAIKYFKEQRFNLIILDIMLPEMDGYKVCEHIRLEKDDVPILFLTAKDSTQDKITGFQKGANDYITKPFHLEEFLLRVKVLLKYSRLNDQTPIDNEYHFGENHVDFRTYKAVCQKGDISLTKKEAKLLKLFIQRNNEVVSREEILQFVWGYDVFPSTRTIDNFILAFRKYFEKDPKHPEFFHSVRGVGYKFTNATQPVTAQAAAN